MMSADDVIALVSRHYCVSRRTIMESTHLHCVRARQAAMYLLREHLQWSYPAIGRLLRRNHTTVIHAVRYVRQQLEAGGDLADIVRLMSAQLYAQQPSARCERCGQLLDRDAQLADLHKAQEQIAERIALLERAR